MALLKQFDIVAIQELRDTAVLTRTEAKLEAFTEVDWRYRVSKPVGREVKECYTSTPQVRGTSVAIGVRR